MDLCTSELVAASLKLLSKLCQGSAMVAGLRVTNQVRDLRFNREQADVLLTVTTVATTEQPSTSCQAPDITVVLAGQKGVKGWIQAFKQEPSPMTSWNRPHM